MKAPDPATKQLLAKAKEAFDLEVAYACARYVVAALDAELTQNPESCTTPPAYDPAKPAESFANLTAYCRDWMQSYPVTQLYMVHQTTLSFMVMCRQMALGRDRNNFLPFNDQMNMKVVADFTTRMLFMTHMRTKTKTTGDYDMDAFDMADQLLTQSRMGELDIHVRFAQSGKNLEEAMITTIKGHVSLAGAVLHRFPALPQLADERAALEQGVALLRPFCPPPTPRPTAAIEQDTVPKKADIIPFKPRPKA